jgi:hypothetical protein
LTALSFATANAIHAPAPVSPKVIANYDYSVHEWTGYIKVRRSGLLTYASGTFEGARGPSGAVHLRRDELARVRRLVDKVHGEADATYRARAFRRTTDQQIGLRPRGRVVRWYTDRDHRAAAPRAVRRVVGYVCRLRPRRVAARARGC